MYPQFTFDRERDGAKTVVLLRRKTMIFEVRGVPKQGNSKCYAHTAGFFEAGYRWMGPLHVLPR